MFAVLTSRRWLAWLAVATAWAIGCYFLGQWQWGRWESKHAAQQEISRNYNSTPIDIAQVLGTASTPLPKSQGWRQVRLVGSYDAAGQLFVRNRSNDGEFGYEVVVPLRLVSGATAIVDRGWVANGANAATPASIPAVPSGQLTVVGWLRPGEPNLDRGAVPGQVSSINIAQIAQLTRTTPYQSYVLMRTEKSATGTPPQPRPLGAPDPGTNAGINLSYALQWWFGAIAGYGFVFMRARREHLDSLGIRPVKPPKVRIWDEEDA